MNKRFDKVREFVKSHPIEVVAASSLLVSTTAIIYGVKSGSFYRLSNAAKEMKNFEVVIGLSEANILDLQTLGDSILIPTDLGDLLMTAVPKK